MKCCDNKEISIVISAEAGQGLQTLERLLLNLFADSGFHVFSYSEFMSRVRGGCNSTEIILCPEYGSSFIKRMDLFIPLGRDSITPYLDRITRETIVIGESENLSSICRDYNCRFFEAPVSAVAKKTGGPKSSNIVVMGIVAGLTGIVPDAGEKIIHRAFKGSQSKQEDSNIAAYQAGINISLEMKSSVNLHLKEIRSDNKKTLIKGAQAVTIGALTGGCNFISSYPMSPSTEVLELFAKYSEKLDLAVEQAEDEICAANMAAASWYAGGRALVTTSGGGFALMAETVSFAGGAELPLVIHIAQRPGPGTGLPTRTEQSDLLFAVHAGHGEFPRAVYAPGNPLQGIELTRRAFETADKYQVPAIILTDQFFIDSYRTVEELTLPEDVSENMITETDRDYRRYEITDGGISPRGIPGYGSGIVCVDSDEHNQGGYITEDRYTRKAMVDKRAEKLETMKKDVVSPVLYGPDNYRYLVICWGSTLMGAVRALEKCGRNDTALLHYSQVYPLHRDTALYMKKAERKIIIENNSTAQFAGLIKMETGLGFDHTMLKYDGWPFSVEEIEDAVMSLL